MKISKPQAVLYVKELAVEAMQDKIVGENDFTVWDFDSVCFCKCKAVFKEKACYVLWKAKHIARKKVRNFEISY
jgi:hypothetical protein